MFKIKNKKGMSLIELVVLIAVIGIMSSISVSSLVNSKRNTELEVASEELVAVLREAQNYALTGKNIVPGCSNYRVNLTNASSNFSLRTYTTPGGSVLCPVMNSNYVFKSGVISSSPTGAVNFMAPHGAVTITTGSVSGTWHVITLSKSGNSYYVCLNTAGLIKKSPNATCN
jgi:type II secretory pathway pseudopilin PulG